MNDERLGRGFDFRRHLGVVYTDILAPANAPDWMRDRAQLWNAVEKAEKRKDSQLARSLDIALPYELSLDRNIELLRGFVQEQWVDKGMIADIAIHLPGRTGDIRNVHAHIALTTREITGSGFGRKERDWNAKSELQEWRKAWADHANRILEREGFEERIDHRSLVDQGIDREPTTHVGPGVKEMERHGFTSDRAQRNRDINAANDNLADLQNELAESEKRLAALRKQLAAERMEQIQKTVRAADAVWEEPEGRSPPAPVARALARAEEGTTDRPLELKPPAPAQERPQEPEPPPNSPRPSCQSAPRYLSFPPTYQGMQPQDGPAHRRSNGCGKPKRSSAPWMPPTGKPNSAGLPSRNLRPNRSPRPHPIRRNQSHPNRNRQHPYRRRCPPARPRAHVPPQSMPASTS